MSYRRRSASPTLRALVTAGVYAGIASLWILFSDLLLARFTQDPVLLSYLQSVKGIAFIGLTAVALFFGLRHSYLSLIRSHEAIARAARDELTGLAGWHHLRQILKRLIQQSRRRNDTMATIVIGIGQLRRINEVFGVTTGDALMMQIAQRLRDLRRSNLMLARPGGGYFVVLVAPPCSQSEAEALAETLVSHIGVPLDVSGERMQVTANAGIALFPRDGQNADALLRSAEIAMVDARTSGESVTTFRRRTAELRARFSLENDLHSALARDEFRLYFQPLVNLDDGSIIGAEALLRWAHPRSGLISPSLFIPLLEKSGDIVQVGQWVLEQAALHAARWPDIHGHAPRVSVNVSRLQLSRDDFVSQVQKVLRTTGLPPGRLVLEITESLAMRDPTETMTRMEELRQVGVGLAMDDFGTGYSSLAYLKRYPLNFLKVDRLFVHGIPVDRENDQLMETIMDMSRRLHLTTVAEGIETPAELARLKTIGCAIGQGFLFAPPMPAHEFDELLEEASLVDELSMASAHRHGFGEGGAMRELSTARKLD